MNKPNIIAIGVGGMGRAFISSANEQGHSVVAAYDTHDFDIKGIKPSHISNLDTDLTSSNLARMENRVIVDFTLCDAFIKNLDTYLKYKLPVVTGTTGWFTYPEVLKSVTEKVNAAGTGLIYSGNFSLGVQATYLITDLASKLFNKIGGFDASIIEEHHIRKADSPSGTAAELGKIIMKGMPNKTKILNGNAPCKISPEELQISAIRRSKVFGTHIVNFEDENQFVEIKHRSDSRKHFAQGAVKAVDFIKDKKGVYNMQDLVKELFAEYVK